MKPVKLKIRLSQMIVNALHPFSIAKVNPKSSKEVLSVELGEVGNVVAAFENRVIDAILIVIAKGTIKMTVPSITLSPRHIPDSVTQNSVQRDFSENTEDTPLTMALSYTDLNAIHCRNDEIRNNQTIEYGIFPVLR